MKKAKFQQRHRPHKEDQSGRFRTEKYNKVKTHWMSSTAEWRGQRKKISEVEDKTINIAQFKQQKENMFKKMKSASGTWGT